MHTQKEFSLASSITRWYSAIDLIESSMLFLNISETDLRAATPCLSTYSITLRNLSFVRNALGRLPCMWFDRSITWEDALEETSKLLGALPPFEDDCLVSIAV